MFLRLEEKCIVFKTHLLNGVCTIPGKQEKLVKKLLKKFQLKLDYIEGNFSETKYYLTNFLTPIQSKQVEQFMEENK